MELTEYKDKCSEDLKIFEIHLKSQFEITAKALEAMKAEISRSDQSENLNGMIQGDAPTEKIESQGDPFQASELVDRLMKQEQMILTIQEKIEEAECELDPLESIEMTNVTYKALKTVLEEEHQLLKILSTNPATKDIISTLAGFPKVKVNTGMDHSLAAEHFVLCKGGDVIIAGIDNLQKQWRLRRFSRLGQLEWDRPLPMSWEECHGIVDFSKNHEVILLSNADRKKIVQVSGDGNHSDAIVCYADDKKAPSGLSITPDSSRLFFKDHSFDHDEGKVEVLDTSTTPFTPLQTITLGFSFTHGLTYLGGYSDVLVFTSYEKKSIRAITAKDGREMWTIGPQVLGKNCQPHDLCTTGNGKSSFAFILEWYQFIFQ